MLRRSIATAAWLGGNRPRPVGSRCQRAQGRQATPFRPLCRCGWKAPWQPGDGRSVARRLGGGDNVASSAAEAAAGGGFDDHSLAGVEHGLVAALEPLQGTAIAAHPVL